MNLINPQVEVQLDEALRCWSAIEPSGAKRADPTDLRGAHTALGAAIGSAPLECPYQLSVGASTVDLWAQTKHLANVARALKAFRLGGKVRPDSLPLRCAGRRWYGLFRVDVMCDFKGWATYIHDVGGEFKKSGKTGDVDQRMGGSYNCLRKVIGSGPPYLGDPWKRRAPFTMLDGQEVDLWVKPQPTQQASKDEEDILNEFYRGEWSKEGWQGQSLRPAWPAELNRRRARVDASVRMAV